MRTAACRCGALTATCEGEPVRISVCHCLACQRRTGSAFGVQARFPAERVQVKGAFKTFVRTGDSGRSALDRFCPDCGSIVCFENETDPSLIAVPVGAFADPGFPAPSISIYECRKHPWTAVLGDAVEHLD